MNWMRLGMLLLWTGGAMASERLTPELLWKLGRVGSASLSPDGSQVAYVVTRYDWQENKGNSDIWLVDIDGKNRRQITSSKAGDNSPVWSADGKSIYFVSKRNGDGQVFQIYLDGGEAVQVTHFTKPFANFHLAPQDAFMSFTREIQLDEKLGDMFPDLPKADARIYDQLKFRHWDSWHEGTYSHLFTADVDGTNQKDLMEGQKSDTPLKPFGGAGDIAIAPDGKEIVYTALVPGRVAASTDSGLFVVDPKGGPATLITKGMEGYDVEPQYSPDGKYLAFLSMETPGYESDRNRIMLYDRGAKTIRELTSGRDQTVNHIQWLNHKTLIFNAPVKGTIQLYEMNIKNGKSRQITQGRHNYSSFDVQAGVLVAIKSTHERPNEIYRIDLKTGEGTRLTAANDDLYAHLEMPKVEEMWTQATDGKQIHSWVIYPPGFDPNKKYPLITYCQGGPQGMISQFFSYRWNFHLMAANGYVVVAVNRRGLPGFGREWNDSINRDYGGQPMRDILSATDAMLEKPFIDRRRTAAVGASFGGYTVFKLMGENVGKQKRFTTMIAHCGLFNLEAWYLGTEELFFPNHDQGGPYWTSDEQRKMYVENSPHTYVDRWETPLLVVHGQKDYRVPVTEGIQAFQAAKIRGLDARFLYFPEEGHWVLSPQNGILWHRVFFQWLGRYCKPGSAKGQAM